MKGTAPTTQDRGDTNTRFCLEGSLGPFSDASVVCMGFGALLIRHLLQRAARGCGSGHPPSKMAIYCVEWASPRLDLQT